MFFVSHTLFFNNWGQQFLKNEKKTLFQVRDKRYKNKTKIVIKNLSTQQNIFPKASLYINRPSIDGHMDGWIGETENSPYTCFPEDPIWSCEFNNINFLWVPKCIYFSKKKIINFKTLCIFPVLPPMSLVVLHRCENFLLNIQNQTLVPPHSKP